jgi:hypothetical protein
MIFALLFGLSPEVDALTNRVPCLVPVVGQPSLAGYCDFRDRITIYYDSVMRPVAQHGYYEPRPDGRQVFISDWLFFGREAP